MRGIAASAALFFVLGACAGASAATNSHPIVFGYGGGNTVPYEVTIEPTGRILHRGPMVPSRHRLSRSETALLFRRVRTSFAAGLASRQCVGTNPDIGSGFIHAFSRTVRVHGACEPAFTKLFNALARAVGLRFG
jgi:hypothetical protein